jgi:signal transduction histidine kinase
MTSAAFPNDAKKTKRRLVSELRMLRARVADLERRLDSEAVHLFETHGPERFGIKKGGRKKEAHLQALLLKFKRTAAEKTALLESSRIILENHDFPQAARSIYATCKKFLKATAGEIILLNQASSNPVALLSEAPECRAHRKGPLLAPELYDYVRHEGVPVCINDFGASKWAKINSRSRTLFKNVLLAPLQLQSETAGILGLANKEGGFQDEDIRLAAAFAGDMAISLRNSCTLETLRASEVKYRQLSETLEARVDEQIATLRQTESLAEMGRMISTVAHEIRNILHIIQMSSEAMRQKLDDPLRLQILDEIDYGVGILKTLGNELLDYSKPVKLQQENCLIKDIAKNAVAAAGNKLQRVKLRLDLRNKNAHVFVDASQINRVLFNLITNAIEAMPKGGTITLSSRLSNRQKPPMVKLAVTDTGCGIPRSELERIQQPFVTTKENGTGLGISICRKIIGAHGGELFIKSKVNKGTTVEIFLPMNKAIHIP